MLEAWLQKQKCLQVRAKYGEELLGSAVDGRCEASQARQENAKPGRRQDGCVDERSADVSGANLVGGDRRNA
jgi:hypothetical protein